MRDCKKVYFLIAIIVIWLVILNLTSYASSSINETLTYKNLVGQNRYDTSILISKEVYSSGTKNIILVNGTDNTDGILAGVLAHKLSAPVLLITKDNLSEEIIKEIKRLNPQKAYLIGGTAVISNSITKKLNNMSISTERVYGSNRYLTAIAVAKKVQTFDKVIICNSRDDGVNASAIAAIAVKNGIPILYNDNSESINYTTYNYIKNNVKTIKRIYIVGNGMSTKQQKMLNGCGISIIKLNGSTPYDINVEMLNKFNSKYNNVVLVNNSIDAISASYLATKNNSLYLYTGTNLTTNQKNIVKNNNISKIYYSGGEKIKGPVKEVVSVLENQDITGETVKLNKSKVVFYVPHQDDETIYFGQTILKAIKEKGVNNVYVIMVSNGANSSVSKQQKIKNELKSNGISFSQARDNEYLAACLALGLKEENILFNEDININRLEDGTIKAEDVKATMKYFENKFNGDVTHITYSFEYDTHNDHMEMGKALNELYYDLSLKEDSFSSVYYIIRSNYNETTNNTKILKVEEKNNIYKLTNALNMYVNKNNSTDKSKIRIGIGNLSVSAEITRTKTEIKEKTLVTKLHLPY